MGGGWGIRFGKSYLNNLKQNSGYLGCQAKEAPLPTSLFFLT